MSIRILMRSVATGGVSHLRRRGRERLAATPFAAPRIPVVNNIEAGVETYWAIHASGAGVIAGLGSASGAKPLIVESYPRYVLKRLWPDLRIPSKRREPDEYTEQVWALLTEAGYVARTEPGRPDHVDAMLCALAARACTESEELPAGTVGAAPYIDEQDGLIREGYIVAP